MLNVSEISPIASVLIAIGSVTTAVLIIAMLAVIMGSIYAWVINIKNDTIIATRARMYVDSHERERKDAVTSEEIYTQFWTARQDYHNLKHAIDWKRR